MRPRPSQRDANVRWYAANREREIERVTRRQAASTAFLRELRDRPCADCGRRFHPVQMAFDHRDPAQKRFTLAKALLKNRADLLVEAAKCDVVCSNCHSVRTRKQHRERLARRGPSQAKGARIDAQRDRWRYYADLLDQLRDVPCVDCGRRFPPCAMEFDHRDPSTKVAAVTRMISNAGWKRISAEADKCDIVCSNCHRLRTFVRRSGSLPERE